MPILAAKIAVNAPITPTTNMAVGALAKITELRATMYTPAVTMVARSSVIFASAPTAMLVVGVIGAFTAIFAASIGIAQNDIKRVMAYSTVSQLGYMFMALGVGPGWRPSSTWSHMLSSRHYC